MRQSQDGSRNTVHGFERTVRTSRKDKQKDTKNVEFGEERIMNECEFAERRGNC